MSTGRYILLVSALLVATLAIAWPALGGVGPGARNAVLFGGLLAWANTGVAYALARWSASRSQNVFLGAVLGGMVGRMGLLLGAVVLGVLVLGMPRAPLAIAVLSYFTVFLAIELTLLHRQTGGREV